MHNINHRLWYISQKHTTSTDSTNKRTREYKQTSKVKGVTRLDLRSQSWLNLAFLTGYC